MDTPQDYDAVLPLRGQTRIRQATAVLRLNTPVDARITSATIVTTPCHDQPTEARADAENLGHTVDGARYRRATEFLATLVVIWTDGRPAHATLAHSILVRVLLEVRRSHEWSNPTTDDEWDWGAAEADKLIAVARSAQNVTNSTTQRTADG
ncbi:hypothetical protein ABZ897_50600 [Nonomuraea sp. NPDC046802]|uniref:hypothetical protein n=1 Tax=Nonomuraea sp. NPDC046802 TaxID=3154919 RepID=UPI00340509A1